LGCDSSILLSDSRDGSSGINDSTSSRHARSSSGSSIGCVGSSSSLVCSIACNANQNNQSATALEAACLMHLA
jgi:hypothetical protein